MANDLNACIALYYYSLVQNLIKNVLCRLSGIISHTKLKTETQNYFKLKKIK